MGFEKKKKVCLYVFFTFEARMSVLTVKTCK